MSGHTRQRANAPARRNRLTHRWARAARRSSCAAPATASRQPRHPQNILEADRDPHVRHRRDAGAKNVLGAPTEIPPHHALMHNAAPGRSIPGRGTSRSLWCSAGEAPCVRSLTTHGSGYGASVGVCGARVGRDGDR
jgi:hypothetical protein